MRFQLSDFLSQPEPATTPALTLWLAFTAAAALSAAVGVLMGAL